MSHDQNFKNLILDYPRQAIEFAAASEAARLGEDVRILPLREEQLKERLVARLNLPNMQYAPEEKVEVYANAVRGLRTLEPDRERQIKYLDFVDIYANLDENERERYQQHYAEEIETMSAFADRFIEQGMQQGEATVLMMLLQEKFGADSVDAHRERIKAANPDQLLRWSKRILTAETPETVFH